MWYWNRIRYKTIAKRCKESWSLYICIYDCISKCAHTRIYILMWTETMQTTAVFTVASIIAVHNIKHIITPHRQGKLASSWSHTHWQWKVASTATVNMEFIWKACSNKPTHLYYSSSASRMISRAVKVLVYILCIKTKKDVINQKPTVSNYSSTNVFTRQKWRTGNYRVT
jgi:hypothetical protein